MVIADTMVDREFGTGCVKITPAHDNNDFKVGDVGLWRAYSGFLGFLGLLTGGLHFVLRFLGFGRLRPSLGRISCIGAWPEPFLDVGAPTIRPEIARMDIAMWD